MHWLVEVREDVVLVFLGVYTLAVAKRRRIGRDLAGRLPRGDGHDQDTGAADKYGDDICRSLVMLPIGPGKSAAC